MKSEIEATLRVITSLDAQSVDRLYGLEPVYEPGGSVIEPGDAAPFVTVQCPYCGESFETRLDLSAGSTTYTEDCQVCCQPVEFAVAVDAVGALEGLELRRED